MRRTPGFTANQLTCQEGSRFAYVVVDVVPDDEGGYSAFTIYYCLEIGQRQVHELVIATREQSQSQEALDNMVDIVLKADVGIEAADLKEVAC